MTVISTHLARSGRALARLPHGVQINVGGVRRVWKWEELCDHLHETHSYIKRRLSPLGLFSRHAKKLSRALRYGAWDDGMPVKNFKKSLGLLYSHYLRLDPVDMVSVSDEVFKCLTELRDADLADWLIEITSEIQEFRELGEEEALEEGRA